MKKQNVADQNSNSKEWHFTANISEELARIGDVLFIGPKQKNLDEQVQMTRLLEAMATASILHFPIRVRYAGERETPDFQLESGGQRIGVELSKIAVQDVEHARDLQRKEMKQPLTISSLFQKQSKPRTKDEVIAEGFLTPAMVFPPVEGYDSIWLEAVTAELDDKTIVLQGKHFRHGAEDWLALRDMIGTTPNEIEHRIESLSDVLALRWKPDWYSRVFLQHENFQCMVMFSFGGYKFSGEHNVGGLT